MLHSEVIGQRPNLTSDYPRAFRFAKRCPGSRGGCPLLGWSLRRFPPTPRGRWRGRFAARRLAWVVDWAFRRGRRLGVPFPSSFVGRPGPPSIVHRKKDGFPRRPVGPPRNDQDCHCEERSDAAIRIPRPLRLPCAKGTVSRRLTEGLSGVAGPFWGNPCSDSHPFPRTRWRKRSAVRRYPWQSRRLSATTRRARRPRRAALSSPRRA